MSQAAFVPAQDSNETNQQPLLSMLVSKAQPQVHLTAGARGIPGMKQYTAPGGAGPGKESMKRAATRKNS